MSDEPNERAADVGADFAAGPLRSDARRNLQTLVTAAKSVFATAGIDAPMREIAETAGVGIGTLYRHFPKRADLIVAVFRHEVETCADAALILTSRNPPSDALTLWIDEYVSLIATKRGLAAALRNNESAYEGLPAYFEERLSPVLDQLLKAASASGGVRSDVRASELLWAIANLCTPKRDGDADVARRMIGLLLEGLRSPHPGL